LLEAVNNKMTIISKMVPKEYSEVNVPSAQLPVEIPLEDLDESKPGKLFREMDQVRKSLGLSY
jgi:hypothetical protein